MRVLGVDFSYKESNMLVSMCRLSNENLKEGIDLECITTFKAENDYDLANLIISQVNNLNVDYVVLDKVGFGVVLYDRLFKELNDKVIGYLSRENNEHGLVSRLAQCPLLEQVGLKLKYKMRSGKVLLDRKLYSKLEYLNVKSLALANYYILEKLFEEEKNENNLKKGDELNILDKYAMFDSHVDNALIDSGFELRYDESIYYEKICKSHIYNIDALIIKITKHLAIIESVSEINGVNCYRVTKNIRDCVSFKGIENKIHECISELEGKYGIAR